MKNGGKEMSISVKNLCKRYKSKIAVKSINFNLTKGKPLAIVGRNGAGKSTIIKMLLGILKPTEGEITGMGKISIGYLPEERGLYPDVTVQDHLVFFAKLLNIPNIESTISYWVKRLELQHYNNFKIRDLSKGNAQKVQLAITLLNNPELVILDEPLSGLDPVNIKLLQSIISNDLKDCYVIMSSHQMSFVESICSEVMILNNGESLIYGSIDSVKQRLGCRKLIIPKKYSSIFSDEFQFEMKGSTIELRLIEPREDLKKIFSILKNEIEIPFLRYELSSLEDIFVRLTNEGANT